MTPDEYAAKREARYHRLLAAADRAETDGSARLAQANQMASVIPFGQPILVGHYSEKADRRYRERIHNKMRRGYELHQHAQELRRRAEASQRNRAIFSDDPAAGEKLADKIARLEQRQAVMRQANVHVRKGDRAALAAMGFGETDITKLFTPDFAGRLGFPGYALTNNNANIRRLKQRLATLEQQASTPAAEPITIGPVTIEDNAAANRVQIFFPDKPAEPVRAALKSHGFRWTPSAEAWQRHRSADALHWAQHIVTQHYGQPA